MLEARGIPSSPDKIWSEVEGDIEKVDNIFAVTRIRVNYHLKIPPGKREIVDRALEIHERGCPAAQSVKRGIALEYAVAEIEEE